MRKSPKKWTEEEINFLKDNYYKTSCEYCAKKLNLPIDVVYGKISRLKLTKECKYNLNLFKNIESKYVAYLLGYFWADGHLRHDRIVLSILKLDGEDIKFVFDQIGYYKIRNQKEFGKNKEKIEYSLCSVELCEIFKKLDYDKKSTISPNKILNIISDDLKSYFYRGIIDGDGCFYINKKQYTYQFSITSSYEQDWKYMIDLCEFLNISYHIKKTINKNKSKYSQFRICKRNDIKIIGEYIYNNYDKIGLKRKYDKYIKII